VTCKTNQATPFSCAASPGPTCLARQPERARWRTGSRLASRHRPGLLGLEQSGKPGERIDTDKLFCTGHEYRTNSSAPQMGCRPHPPGSPGEGASLVSPPPAGLQEWVGGLVRGPPWRAGTKPVLPASLARASALWTRIHDSSWEHTAAPLGPSPAAVSSPNTAPASHNARLRKIWEWA